MKTISAARIRSCTRMATESRMDLQILERRLLRGAAIVFSKNSGFTWPTIPHCCVELSEGLRAFRRELHWRTAFLHTVEKLANSDGPRFVRSASCDRKRLRGCGQDADSVILFLRKFVSSASSGKTRLHNYIKVAATKRSFLLENGISRPFVREPGFSFRYW